jgi:WD40 repeat protein
MKRKEDTSTHSRVNILGNSNADGISGSIPGGKKYDWGDSPDLSVFFGRTDELDTFFQWIVTQKCRVLGLWGMGGMGKSTFTLKVCKGQNNINDAKCIRDDFEYIIFRRLDETHRLSDILSDAILLFSNGSKSSSLKDGELMDTVLSLLAEKRCLIVLDNAESITENQADGSVKYKIGFENYKIFIDRIGKTKHQSCLFINGREKLDGFSLLQESAPNYVKSHDLNPIDVEAGKSLFTSNGEVFSASGEDWNQIVTLYDGNPLHLLLIKKYIEEIHSSDIKDFLSSGKLLIKGINNLIDWHFNRLSTYERDVLLWMAIHREFVSINMFEKDLCYEINAQRTIRDTILTLMDKIPLEKSDGRYSMQPVLLEYATNYLIKAVSNDIKDTTIESIGKYSLLLTSSFVNIQELQTTIFLDSINAICLSHFLTLDKYHYALKNLINTIRENYSDVCYYAIGNIINLLSKKEKILEEWDFSEFLIVNANLQEVDLREINFSQSEFIDCIFKSPLVGPISGLAVSHDGQYIAASESFGGIHIYELSSLQLINTLRSHVSWVFALSFSPDDSYIVSGGEDKMVYMWGNWKQEDYKAEIIDRTHSNSVWTVTISGNKKYIVTGSEDESIHIYDTEEMKILKRIPKAHKGKVFSVSFNYNSTLLVSSGADGIIKLWDVETNFNHSYNLTGHEGIVKNVMFTNDGNQIVSCGWDKTIRFWDLRLRTEIADKRITSTESILSLVLDPKSPYLVCSLETGIIQVWNYETNACIKNITSHKGEVWKIVFTADAKYLVSGGYDRTLRIWNTNNWSCRNVLHGYINWIQDFSLSKDGNTLVCTNGDLSIDIWDVQTIELDVIPDAHNGWTFSVEHCPKSHFVITGSDDRKIRIWDTIDWHKNPIELPQVHNSWIQRIAFSSNGDLLASGSDDKSVVVWDMKTRSVKHTLKGHTFGVWALAFSPDNKILASADEVGAIILWDAVKGKRIKKFPKLCDRIHAIVFSKDGKFLYSASEDSKVRRWNIDDKSNIELYNHNGWVMELAISQDGQKLVSGGKDGKVIVYNLSENNEISINHGFGVWAVSFSHDGNTIISAGEDGTTIFWTVVDNIPCIDKIFCKKKPYEDSFFSKSKGLSRPQILSLIALGGK